MTENKEMVSEDLSKAGEASVITPLLMELDKLRIVSTSDRCGRVVVLIPPE